MRQIRGNERLELRNEPMDALGRQIESKQLDGDEPVAFRIAGAKDRTQDACADLMKNTKRPEGVFWLSAGNVRVQ